MAMKELVDIVDILLPISLLLNAVAYLPQIWRLFKVKESKELSIWTFILFWVGIFLVTVHGIFQHDYVLAWSYSPSLITCTVILVMIVYYRKSRK